MIEKSRVSLHRLQHIFENIRSEKNEENPERQIIEHTSMSDRWDAWVKAVDH